MTQRHKVSKCYWKNGTNRPVSCGVATNLQFVKKKQNKTKKTVSEKLNKTRYVCNNYWYSEVELFKLLSLAFVDPEIKEAVLQPEAN